MSGFAERLVEAVQERGSCVCLGLDPRADLLPDEYRVGDDADARAAAFGAFCKEAIDRAAPHVVAAKPQSAFFEVLGSAGVAAFEDVCRHARSRGLLVIADVKRGDIGSTAEAYAEAWLGDPLGRGPVADACTVNPYLGEDGILPFVSTGEARSAGIFLLVKTSNPSSGRLQDLDVAGEPVHVHVARMVGELNASRLGPSGYGPVGAVVGATWPRSLSRLRSMLQHSILLLPGYGAQGAGAADVAAAFDGRGQGCLVAASRSLTFPWRSEGACPADWRERISAAARGMQAELETVRREAARHG